MNTWTDEHTAEFLDKAEKLYEQLYLESTALYLDGMTHMEKLEENTKKISYNNQQQTVLRKLTIEVAKANALYRLEQMGL